MRVLLALESMLTWSARPLGFLRVSLIHCTVGVLTPCNFSSCGKLDCITCGSGGLCLCFLLAAGVEKQIKIQQSSLEVIGTAWSGQGQPMVGDTPDSALWIAPYLNGRVGIFKCHCGRNRIPKGQLQFRPHSQSQLWGKLPLVHLFRCCLKPWKEFSYQVYFQHCSIT